jgi:hypothetical protein
MGCCLSSKQQQPVAQTKAPLINTPNSSSSTISTPKTFGTVDSQSDKSTLGMINFPETILVHILLEILGIYVYNC